MICWFKIYSWTTVLPLSYITLFLNFDRPCSNCHHQAHWTSFPPPGRESHQWSRCRSCSITQYGALSVQIVTTSRPCCVEIASIESWGQLRLFQAQAQKPSRKVGQKPVTSKPKHTTAYKVLVSAVLGMRLALVLDASIYPMCYI